MLVFLGWLSCIPWDGIAKLPKIQGQRLRLPHRNDAKIAEICNLWTLPELQGKTSRGCTNQICTFIMHDSTRQRRMGHHSYEVTLNGLTWGTPPVVEVIDEKQYMAIIAELLKKSESLTKT